MLTKISKQKINQIYCTTLALVLIVSFSFLQNNKNHNPLDLFGGILKSKASSGNIKPVQICSSGAYQQFATTPTLGAVNLSTPIDTPLVLTASMFEGTMNPSLSLTQKTEFLCLQGLPTYGDLKLNGLVVIPSNNRSYIGANVNPTITSPLTFIPPSGFVGTACFDAFVDVRDSAPFGKSEDTNVNTVQIQVGGSTITCGVPKTPFVTVAVEHNTTNHLPNITGTCSVGDTMTFVIKKGATNVVSETISKLCDVSPYALTPTISIPDGKYRVDVTIGTSFLSA